MSWQKSEEDARPTLLALSESEDLHCGFDL